MTSPVLIIDDEPYMRVLLQQTLEELGDAITVFEASGGREGLEMARLHRPRMIFLDIMMPEVNGLDICRQLRQDSAFDETVIVLLTARGEETNDRADGMACGANYYMVKPFDPDDIVALVQSCL